VAQAALFSLLIRRGERRCGDMVVCPWRGLAAGFTEQPTVAHVKVPVQCGVALSIKSNCGRTACCAAEIQIPVRAHNGVVSSQIISDYFLTSGTVSTRLQRRALWLLALVGWRVRFAPLPGPRGVVIVYPHTSNWDFILGLLAKWAIGKPVHWLGKEALFRGLCGALLGPLLRACGGQPIERGTSTGAIERLAQQIHAADWYWLALAPEGTRNYRDSWRSGFYHLALAAQVPLAMAYIDYARKEVGLVAHVKLSGDVTADLAAIRAVYQDRRGLRHRLAAPIVFQNADAKPE